MFNDLSEVVTLSVMEVLSQCILESPPKAFHDSVVVGVAGS